MRSTGTQLCIEAFGIDDLGPEAPAGSDVWVRAVALGARGRAAAARALLDDLDRGSPVVRSLAASTRGSLVRQSGRHAVARVDDGRACAVAAQTGGGLWERTAWLDGVIGLAADNLGVGAFDAASDLLSRVGDELDRIPTCDAVNWVTTPRVRLRHAWVNAEHALYSGDVALSSEWRTRADELAAISPSVRHRIKTDLIGAAVDAANGRSAAAVALAHDVENRCEERGLLPLQWAAATMLAGIDPTDEQASRRAGDLITRMSFLGMSFATGA